MSSPRLLRLFLQTPLLIPHKSSDNCQIGGFHLLKDTILFINAWAIHKDPKLWEDSSSFKPKRFGIGENEIYKLLPFGVGRTCPRASLANQVLGYDMISYRFHIRVWSGT